MKNGILKIMLVTVLVSGGIFVYQEKHVEAVSDLAFSEVEALSYCEITRNGKIILECLGDEGTCSIIYQGYTLKCDGKEIIEKFPN